MGHYGLLVPAYMGHLNPMAALGRALQQRGHRITLISPLDSEPTVRAAGLEFIPIATTEFPSGEWTRTAAEAGRFAGRRATRAATRGLARLARGILRDLPGVLERERFDGLVLDQIALGGEGVCEVLRMPLAVVCNSLMLHAEPTIPPIICSWAYGTDLWSVVRNLAGYAFHNSMGIPVVRELLPYRSRHKLGWLNLSHINRMPPSLVQVAQLPAFLDFPRRRLPKRFHYTGPWTEPAARQDDSFPWERLNGQPLIYASLGTLQNRLEHAYEIILEACRGLDAQLVLARGRKDAAAPQAVPDGAVVVGYAPQLALLKRAALVITHAGLNTTLEALAEGLPLVMVPITNDQPGVAARVQRVGAGLSLPVQKLSTPSLRRMIEMVLGNPDYRRSAQNCAEQMRRFDGLARAAELIERAFSTRQSVTREN
jgi:MGT family glycosyltransferase